LIPSLFANPLLLLLDAILLFLKAVQFFNNELKSFFCNNHQLWIV
jgi:hypothetical protein